ncbi:choline dehydrogenase [Breoghania corrubedonensis]|uniref:Choline dehydrogenase n=1 Tax=Breoghania corrubedonensis TaxID=665038 RepID=A0A2T5V7Q3_9HYPH|nr:choline dehydrogenase [Breoghania corrubedonensis]PTW59788.1 choline dehydrogenase [Breoghania corrubedonensis]
MNQYDYIVVGAGSAGCALATRLSEDPKNAVLLLEYGGSDFGPFIQMPAALSYPMSMKCYDWGFESEPEPHLGGRRLQTPRGKVIGGSSAINGMVYVRGHAGDFDTWAEMGAAGWDYASVLPYFKRMETSHGAQSAWRGTHGPVHVTRGARKNPLHDAFIEAGGQAGYSRTADYNGERQEGFGEMEMTVWRGKRWSAADAYLKPAMKRPNLTVVTGAMTRRVLMESVQAVGVEYEVRGAIQTALAEKEIVLAASAINSPKLLMASGIGNAEELKRAGIVPLVHRPGVGLNLQDHLEVYVQQACTQPITLYKYWNLFGKALVGAQWFFTRTGIGASNQFESCGFIRSRAGVSYPDIQFHFLPMAVRYDGQTAAEGHGYQAHVGPMRSASRGTVQLAGPDPAQKPVIRFNYMSEPEDWADFRQAIRLTREIFAQGAFAPFRGKEIQPGEDAVSDAAIDDFVREHAESAYHPCGTCRMGAADDPFAVVDPECRVIGVKGLRVADSSIFPRITNGNLNAPSIMVGEKAADHILGKSLPPATNVPAWWHPDWRNSQR